MNFQYILTAEISIETNKMSLEEDDNNDDDDVLRLIYISDDDEDVGEVVDITVPFWTMVEHLQTVPFDIIRQAGIYRAVQHYINMDVSYQLYVSEHDKILEYQTIQDVMDGVTNYYKSYLPDSERTHMLESAMEIIRTHVELDQQIDDVAMQLSEL